MNARTFLPGNYLATALAKSVAPEGYELQITVTNIVTAEVTTEVYVTVDVNDNECNAYQVAVSSDGVWLFLSSTTLTCTKSIQTFKSTD